MKLIKLKKLINVFSFCDFSQIGSESRETTEINFINFSQRGPEIKEINDIN